jgi:NAD(P)-dependent dehydrogenase (short-subunit alcohol dehydrogenase family)
MTGKVLIYGGSGGIGSVTGRALLDRGYGLHLVARNEETLAAVARDLGATHTAGDVEDPGLFVRATQDAGEPLAGLVYAVGTIRLKPLHRLTEEEFLRDFRINASGAALAVQAALPALKKAENGASVVFFSSVAVAQGFTAHASIGMAKGAVEGLTRSLAAEFAPKVRVNAIAPSLTRTPLAESLLSSEPMAAAIAGLHALGRLGEPRDVAALAAFLVGPESGWITGQVFGVDGGRSRVRAKG